MVLALKPSEKVTPKQSEWAAAGNRTQVYTNAWGSRTATGLQTRFIYTVPTGKMLYVTGVYLNASLISTGATGAAAMFISSSDTNKNLLYMLGYIHLNLGVPVWFLLHLFLGLPLPQCV